MDALKHLTKFFVMCAFNSSSFSCDKNLERINYISERTYMHSSEAKVEINFTLNSPKPEFTSGLLIIPRVISEE